MRTGTSSAKGGCSDPLRVDEGNDLAFTATIKYEQGSCSSGAPGGAANARGRPGGV